MGFLQLRKNAIMNIIHVVKMIKQFNVLHN